MVIIKLKKLVDGFLNWAVNDYINHVNKSETWLYEAFFHLQVPQFEVYTQLVDLLTRDIEDPRKVETRLMFDPSRAESPTIHIHMPQEEPHEGNLVGMGFGGLLSADTSQFSGNHMKFFGSTYDIIVTSNNQMEVILLYEFLKRIFIAGSDSLDHNFAKFEISGKELMYDNTLMPDVFYRAISLNIIDPITVPTIKGRDIGVTDITAKPYFGGFEIPNYVVIFSASIGGTVKCFVNLEEIQSGDEINELYFIRFEATPEEGYQVKEWKNNTVVIENVTNNYSFTLENTTEVTVEFELI